MTISNVSNCPSCGGNLKHYDKVIRIIRKKCGIKHKVKIPRLRCVDCRKIHRKLPDFIFPYKQYDRSIIFGVINGIITPDTIGYEDYPCELTMKRWTRDVSMPIYLLFLSRIITLF